MTLRLSEIHDLYNCRWVRYFDFHKAMKKYYLYVLACLCYSAAVGQHEHSGSTNDELYSSQIEEDYVSSLEQAIIGEWTNVSMRVWVKTYNNSDTSFIVDITEDNWDLKMNIKPIVTTIHEDGTYTSEFRTSFDSLIYQPKGTWLLDGDTLIMEDHQATYKYQIFLDGDRAEFNSLVDWDNDGKTDDEYRGVQRKSQ